MPKQYECLLHFALNLAVVHYLFGYVRKHDVGGWHSTCLVGAEAMFVLAIRLTAAPTQQVALSGSLKTSLRYRKQHRWQGVGAVGVCQVRNTERVAKSRTDVFTTLFEELVYYLLRRKSLVFAKSLTHGLQFQRLAQRKPADPGALQRLLLVSFLVRNG